MKVELSKMAVSPQAQGQGIGRKLMMHAIDYAQKKKYRSVILYSNTKLTPAIKLYEKFGFGRNSFGVQ